MHELLTKPRIVVENPGGYHSRTKEIEPFINEALAEAVKEAADKAVRLWLEENKGQIKELVQEAVDGSIKRVLAGTFQQICMGYESQLTGRMQEQIQVALSIQQS